MELLNLEIRSFHQKLIFFKNQINLLNKNLQNCCCTAKVDEWKSNRVPHFKSKIENRHESKLKKLDIDVSQKFPKTRIFNFSGIEMPFDLRTVLEKGLKTPIKSPITEEVFLEALNSLLNL